LLTGRPPFLGGTDVDTLKQVLEAEPAPPRRLRPDLPRDLDTLCLRCLEKHPRRRYAGAAALADDLRRFLDGRPIHARPVRAWERVWKWLRRRPATAGLLAVTAAALAGLVLGAVLYSAQLRRHNVELGATAAREREQRELADRRPANPGMRCI